MGNSKWLYFIVWAFSSSTSNAQINGSVIQRDKVAFPKYSAIKDISWYYPENEYQSAITDKKILFEKLIYYSDGLKVVAFLTTPANPEKRKYPVVIFNRGSYIRNDIAFVHAPLFKRLVDNGFIVIAPALRESDGGEGKDELGGKELADIMNTKELLKSVETADTENIFMLGESRGGIMTFQAIKNQYSMRAAATVGAITDLNAYIADQRWEEKTLTGIWSDYNVHKKEILENRSVLNWFDAINVPILLLHGAKDPQVKPDHALQLAQNFLTSGKEFQLIIFADGNHILSGSVTEERDRQIIAWFKKYIK